MQKILSSRLFWTVLIIIFICAAFLSDHPAGAKVPDPPSPVFALIMFCSVLFFSQFYELNSAIFNAQYPKAAEIAERLRLIAPRTAYSALAVAYAGMRKGERALAYANKAIELSPRNARFHLIRALARMVAHDFENALNDCAKSLELDSSITYNYVLKAECYLLMGNLQEASRQLEKAQSAPTKIPAVQSAVLSAVAIGKLSSGDIVAAKESAQKAVLAYQSSSAYLALGLVLFKESDLEGAIAEFSHAIEKDSYYPLAYWYRNEAYYAAGKVELAHNDLEKAESLSAYPYPMLCEFS